MIFLIEIETFEDLKNKEWKIEMKEKGNLNMNILSLITLWRKIVE